MKKLTLDEIKEIQLSIMKTVDAFCRSNNIGYTLAGGTLIGAVRHRGYIPWDDDIDIYILRKDYERFITEFSSPNHKVYTHNSDPNYYYSFAKVSDERTVLKEYTLESKQKNIGINIDVFPVDNIPNGDLKAKIFMWKVRLLRLVTGSKRRLIHKGQNLSTNCFIAICKTLLLPFSFSFLNIIIDKIATKYINKETGYVGNVVYGWGTRERCPKTGWDKHVEVDFEGEKFYAISSYDIYLTNVFGDYMTPPPVEKQVSHHFYEAFEK